MFQQESPIQSLLRQKQLLKLEHDAEKEQYRRQTEASGLRRGIKRGDVWCPLSVGRSYYNSLNQLVVEVMRQDDTDIEHNFEYGRPVVFFRISAGSVSAGSDGKSSDGVRNAGKNKEKEKITYLSFTGTVSYADSTRMVVVVPDAAAVASLHDGDGELGVQLFFDETSYRAMNDALDRVINAKGTRLAYLRDLFYSRMPAARFSFEPMRFPWLNASQEKAVNEVLRAKDVAVVHGPPGTGKTTTLVEAINETLMRESQVLVCAQSNMAVDWISEKLADRGISVLRIGNPSRVTDKMLSFTYERRFESHPDYPQLWAMRKAIREMRSRRRGATEQMHQKLDRLRSRAGALEIKINSDLFGEARVIACTLVGAASRLLDGRKFATLFIDEAAQALEAACWIPMRRCARVVLAGDHCQLPPTVKSFEAMKGGLARTLMERIVANKPEVVTLLTMQYRMNERIMHFSSEWFYGGRVETAPEARHRGILDYDNPIDWIDTDGMNIEAADGNADDGGVATAAVGEDFREQFIGGTFGRVNKGEAVLTMRVLRSYMEKIGRQRALDESIDVGVISPYRAQVQHLRQLVKRDETLRPLRHLITVNTVDGFQGQERDIIIISMVRSNAGGEIGFLSDLRRMNVAMTRARMKLIILGSRSTLTRHAFYARLWDYVQSCRADGSAQAHEDNGGEIIAGDEAGNE